MTDDGVLLVMILVNYTTLFVLRVCIKITLERLFGLHVRSSGCGDLQGQMIDTSTQYAPAIKVRAALQSGFLGAISKRLDD